jgi:hypothetical protein
VAVAGGGAYTVGENGFGAFGAIRGAFSVGDAGGGAGVVAAVVVVAVVVVVVVVVSGDSPSSLEHAAVNAPIASTAATPAMAGTRRSKPLCLVMTRA